MALDQIEAKCAQKMRKQDDPLLHRKRHADAHARPSAERDVSETVDAVTPFAQETGGIEGVRMVPKAPAPVQDVRGDRDHRASRNRHACEFVIRDRVARKHRRRGIKAQRFLEDGSKDFAPFRRD